MKWSLIPLALLMAMCAAPTEQQSIGQLSGHRGSSPGVISSNGDGKLRTYNGAGVTPIAPATRPAADPEKVALAGIMNCLRENYELRIQLAQLKGSPPPLSEETGTLRANFLKSISDQSAENEQIKSAIVTANAVADDATRKLDALRSENLRLQSNVTTLSDKLQTQGAGYNAEYQETINGLNKVIATLKTENASLWAKLNAAPMAIAINAVGRVSGVVHILQIIDAQNMLVTIDNKTLWIKGLATSNLADDLDVELQGQYSVTGTKQFSTKLHGVRTVYLLERK